MTKSARVAFFALALAGCTSTSTGASASASSSPSSAATPNAVASNDPPTVSSGLAAASSVLGLDGTAPSAPPAVLGTDPLFADEGAIVEASEDGSSAFVVDPEGRVTAALAGPDGKPTTDRTVKLNFVNDGATAPRDVLLIPDSERRYLTGHGPTLDADITPVSYEITGGPKPIRGVLHIPRGGTKALVTSSAVVAAAHVAPVLGPHGGRIERVGDDDVELLIDPDSGEARAWVIVDGKVVPPNDREVGLYLDGRYVDCWPDQNDSFYVKLDARFEVRALHKVSLALTTHEHVHAVVWGFRPHVAVYIARPAIDVRVVGWTTTEKVKWDKNPNEPGLGWAKGKEKHHASAGVSVSVGVSAGGHHEEHGGGKGGGKGGKGKGKH